MKKLFTLVALLVSQLVFAQTGPYWLLKGGGNMVDEALDISIDAIGNTYTTGYFSGIATFGPNITLTSNGVTDIFIAKVDTNGNYVWAVKAGGYGPDKGNSIKTDAQGNSYVTGFYQGSAFFGSATITSVGNSQDIFLAKYNNQGVLQWVKSAGGMLGDLGNAVSLDNAGNVFITGHFEGTAIFGSINITSAVFPHTTTPSQDVFVAKYSSSNGNIIWVKKGSAPYNDRGMEIACDVSGNVYVTGQFSDTITFDVTHNNNLYNSIFLIKFNASGIEQWFRKIGASAQCISYGIAVDNNSNIFITGDFINQLIFFDASNYTLTNTYPNGIFIAKYNPAGNLLWAKSEGSNSEITARNIAMDNSSNAYITGSFKCRMNGFADTYGQGTFNSVGYWDIFAVKYNSSGNRLWAQQSGGRQDDRSYGIVVNNDHDIIICGGFYDVIYFPASKDFIWPSTAYSHIDNYSFFTTYCNDSYYESFYEMNSLGVSDVFICKGFDPDRSPFDYYYRVGSASCTKPYLGVELEDSAEYCGNYPLHAISNTGYVGPLFNYSWSSGSPNATVSGFYSVTQTSYDGCFISKDSIYVTIYPKPPTPTITDSKGVNINAVNARTIYLCLPDSVVLTAGNICNGCTCTWIGPGTILSPTSIRPFKEGIFMVRVTDSNNCYIINSVRVEMDSVLKLPYISSNLVGPDTISLCQGKSFAVYIIDSMINKPYYQHSTKWSFNPPVFNSPIEHSVTLIPNVSGLYYIYSEHKILLKNDCGADSVIFYDTIAVYVKISTVPVVNISLIGNMTLCPGDTTIITAVTNGSQYNWSGSGIIGTFNQLSVKITGPGNYSFYSQITDSNGCIGSNVVHFIITNNTSPTVTMLPSNGLICPNDSVELFCSGTGIYNWYGPAGLFASNQQSVFVKTPGFYYCVLTDSTGCSLASNTVEVLQYSTPYLLVLPSTVICPGKSVTIRVITNVGSIVQWQPPLSGSALSQIITLPGTYSCKITSCGITNYESVTITSSPLTNNITCNGPLYLCNGDSVILTASGSGVIYQWSDSSASNSIIVYQPGTYSVTITDVYGCTVNSLPLTIGGSQIPPPILNNVTICHGTSAMLHAVCSGTLQWFGNASGGAPLFTGNDYITPPILSNTTYYVQVYDSVCDYPMIPVVVSIFPGSETPVITSNSPLCVGDTIKINIDPVTANKYSWSGPLGFESDLPNIQIPDATTSNSGIYTLVVSSDSCPDRIVSKNIEVNLYPEAQFSYSLLPICEGVKGDFISTTLFSTGTEWYFSDGFTYSGSSVSHIFNYDETVEVFFIANNVTCRDTMHISLPMHYPDLVVLPPPNVFTPNGDGFNDCFKLKTSEGYESCYQMEVFNRWGNLLFKLDNDHVCWDGKNQNNGEDCASGVYYFVITIGEKSYNGSVTLLR